MKRLDRKSEKFDPLDLYTALSRQMEYKIGVERDNEDFHMRIAGSLKAALDNPAMLHGKRIEAMFAHVVSALGSCVLIKQEDIGAAFVSSDKFQFPDYRVVTENGDTLLIEVKNCHQHKRKFRFDLKRSYVRKLRNYADVNGASLKFAIYFSRINRWVLLSPESFIVDARRVWIDLPHAIAKNEFSLLGDRMVATLPPLSIEFVGDPDDERCDANEGGRFEFTIREIRIKCSGKSITTYAEKHIAFYFMRYGDWIEQEPSVQVENGRLVSISFDFAPNDPVDDQPFQFVGDLSSMISTAFGELTTSRDNSVASLDVDVEPAFFSVNIPKDYKGDALPLWQFVLEPNPEYLREAQPAE